MATTSSISARCDIEDRCFRLLALQQPMASDLRAIITAVKLVGEIERSGDLVVNICKGARRLYGRSFDPMIRGLITRMSDEAQQLFRPCPRRVRRG